MYIDFKKIISVLVLLTIGIGIGILGVKLVQYYQTPKQTVSVVGAGEIDAVTDQANITVQIKTTSTTYEKAQEENKKDVDKLKSDLTKLGIPESRITTSSYSPPIFRDEPPSVDLMIAPEGKTIPSYRPNTTPTVTTTITLVLDPIKNIEKIFDAISKNTNAQITDTYYSLKNRKTWESKAKEEALKDARNQIESAAKINHLRVGKLLTLEDASIPKPYPVAMMKALNGQAPTAEDQSVSAGNETTQVKEDNVYYSEQTVKITSSYTATYELY
jgi:uncharacterized protein YggE